MTLSANFDFCFPPYMPSDVQVLNVFVSVFSFVNGIDIVT